MLKTTILRTCSLAILVGVAAIGTSCKCKPCPDPNPCPAGQECQPKKQISAIDPPDGPMIVVEPKPPLATHPIKIATATADCISVSDANLNEKWFHKKVKFEADVILVPGGNPVTVALQKFVGKFKHSDGTIYTFMTEAVPTSGSKKQSLRYTLSGGTFNDTVLTPVVRTDSNGDPSDRVLRDELCGEPVELKVWGTFNGNAVEELIDDIDDPDDPNDLFEQVKLKAKW